ncbi:MAG TPA: Hsp20 family protein [Opitutaceae bacterium]
MSQLTQWDPFRELQDMHNRLTLPEDAEADKVTAAHKDGVLTVTVAKSEHARHRQVEINVV